MKIFDWVKEKIQKGTEYTDKVEQVYKWGKRLMPRKEIVIIGCGGVGKSTLAGYLSGRFQTIHDVPGEYEESHGLEEIEIEGLQGVTALVAPGQFEKRQNFWPQLEKAITEKKSVKGVILVAAYGYHSQITHLHVTSAELPDLLEERRKEELDLRDMLANWCIKRKHRLWILEVILKKDLWFDQEETVRAFYTPDLKDLIIGENNAPKDRQIYSLTVDLALKIESLTAENGDILVPISTQFNSAKQAESCRSLDKAIEAINSWQ